MRRAIKLSLVVYACLGAVGAILWWLEPSFFTGVKGALTGRGEFVFDYPWLLLTILPVLPLVLLALSRPRRKKVATMVFTRGDLVAGAPKTWRYRMRSWPTLLRALGICVLCLALARPQVASEERLEAEGIDIYVILDMSGSMQAIDMTEAEVRFAALQNQPIPNRFENARSVLMDFVERRRDNPWFDRVGMVIFARQAFLQFPLTIDYNTILWLLERLELNDIDASQTAIGNAIGRAVLGLIDSDSASRIIILITDGDERGGNVSAIEAARVAADEGIPVYPILVGREGAVLVPAVRSAFGFGQIYERREYPVDPELLQEIADVTGGGFFRAADRQALETTLEEILESFEKTAHAERIRERPEEAFFPFAWAGFILLGLDLLLRYAVVRKFP